MVTRNIAVAALAVMLALTLSACGGGGGGASVPAPTDPPPVDPAPGQRMAVNGAIGAAQMAVNALTATSMDADIEGAKTKLEDARTALAAGTALSAEERAAFTLAINGIADTLTSRETEIMTARMNADKARMAETTATAKALMKALTNADAAAATVTTP